MIRRLTILLLIVGCDTKSNNSEGFPNDVGNYWTYSCNTSISYNTNSADLIMGGFSSLKIIDYNLESDSCGQNIMIIEKADSIISFDNEPLIVCEDTTSIDCFYEGVSIIGNVIIDTIIYSISKDSIEFCSSIKSLHQTVNTDTTTEDSSVNPDQPDIVTKKVTDYFHLSKPPNIKYPLFIGNSWNTYKNNIPLNYEVIGRENINIEMSSGNTILYNCYILKRSVTDIIDTYYYISSEGLIKSHATSEHTETVTEETPEDGLSLLTINQDCLLIDH